MTAQTRLLRAALARVLLPAFVCSAAMLLASCEKHEGESASGEMHEEPAAPTNRIDIPPAVRQNLGMTFAKVEPRNVAATLRVPGSFELLPSARHEYRAMVPGTITLHVAQYQRVSPGDVLFTISSPAWFGLKRELADAAAERSLARAAAESIGPLLAAHEAHHAELEKAVEIWTARVLMLEKLGGGVSADELAQTRTSLAQARSQLAETLEKEAELEARRKVSLATLKASEAKLLHLAGQAAAITGIPLPENPADDAALEVWSKINVVEVRAGTAGIVHTFSVVSGALVDQHGPVLTVINPEQVRFRARVMLSDLGRLRDGMQARIAPPQGAYVHVQDTMSGTITLDPAANPLERTLDILLMPESLGAWARPGVAAHLEITLAGGGEELAIPVAAVCRDGNTPIIFRRDPSNPDKVIRLEADLGVSDGRWIVIKSGVAEGNEVVVDGVYQLLLATSGSAPKGGHFHPDGTYHEGSH